ncbi:MAG: DUF1616 domain-containing protein [Chloroflexi bacterium]|nr:DUF1616 domain-containing protein [Chloroflexota bacterium]MCC6891663.1 hypothetical protein [Anaerolineae bacterium]
MLIRKTPQLLLIAVATVIMAVILWLDPQIGFIRTIFASLLLIFVGHTALHAWGAGLRLRGAVWILMTIILGLTIMTLGGLILHFTSWGLQLQSWIGFIVAVTLIQVIVGLVRGRAEPGLVAPTSVQSWNFELKPLQFVVLVLAVAIASISILVARNGVLNQPHTTFSQVWMVASNPDKSQVNLGIKNEEQKAVTYRLVVQQGSTVIHEYPSLLLQADETWQDVLDVDTNRDTAVPIEAVLYRTDEPNQPYRTVNLWLN